MYPRPLWRCQDPQVFFLSLQNAYVHRFPQPCTPAPETRPCEGRARSVPSGQESRDPGAAAEASVSNGGGRPKPERDAGDQEQALQRAP